MPIGQVDYVVSSGMFLKIYGCVLLGFYTGRNEIHNRLQDRMKVVKRIAVAGVPVGIPMNVLYARNFESESAAHALLETIAILPLGPCRGR